MPNLALKLAISRWSGLVLLLVSSCAPGAAEEIAPTASPTVVPTRAPVQPTSTVSSLSGRVSIWLSWGPEAVHSLTLLTEAFAAMHPQVEFSLTYFPEGDIVPALGSEDDALSFPTLFFAASQEGPSLLNGGTVRDLRMLLPDQFPEQVYPLAWSQVRYGEAVVGVPIRMDGNVLYRNRTLAPRPAADTDGLLETAEELRSVGLTGAYFDFGAGLSMPFANTCEIDFAPREGRAEFDGEGGICWLELLQAMSAAGPVTIGSEDDLSVFEGGTSGWYLGTTEETVRLNQSLGENAVSIDPWPVYSGTGRRLTGYVWTENAYLHAATEEADLEANLEFMLFLISPEAQLTLSGIHAGRFNSVRPSVLPEHPQQEQIKLTLEQGVPFPIWNEGFPHQEALERAARAVAIQGTDIDTAYERALADMRGEEEQDE